MLKQTLQQKQLQKLSPQQIQLMKLIQLHTQEFEDRIKEEIEENPALDEGREADPDNLSNEETWEDEPNNDPLKDLEDFLPEDEIPDYRTQSSNYSSDDEDRSMPVGESKSFSDIVRAQVGMLTLNEQEQQLAHYIIGSLDDSGYLERPLDRIADDLAFSVGVYTDEAALLRVLKQVQALDPPGIGARDLRECLLLQLQRKSQTPVVAIAISIVKDYFEEFSKKHYEKLTQRLQCTQEELKEAVAMISKLNPKPGNTIATGKPTETVTPDFILDSNDGELELSLNSRNAPQLHVSRQMREILETYQNDKDSKSAKEAAVYAKQKIDSAKWFIDAIKQRQDTLLRTMSAIVEYQREYFLSGDERQLKPMILKDIADKIKMDISTISRVASNKYIQTPYGTFLIKKFFSESMKNEEGEDVSTIKIKKILEEVIEEENPKKPLTDEKLAKILKEKGYPIARRTIAKYREQLNIPIARLRKTL
ncbi:MAG: RNA polymerase factor sigma-54 [Schleiferiaceae bacterium]|nr:RNA polymerase factor sigma-54 [Schleiferiaceae bacterium]